MTKKNKRERMFKRMEIKILIVCYSYSGKTRRIAEMIQKQTGGRLSRIYPRQPYPDDFQSLLTQVREEIRTGRKVPLLPVEENADEYDVVFAGSPNWCGTIAPPLASWLYRNDLSGKIILPFYSHCGGVLCDFRRDIRKICPKADVREPLGVLDNEKKDMGDRFRDWFLRTGTECLIRSGK